MSNMTSYKRKRIESWCEEVGHYLKNGTICRSVIGHVAEDGICGNALSSAANDEVTNSDNQENADRSDGIGGKLVGVGGKLDFPLKHAAHALLLAGDPFGSKRDGIGIGGAVGLPGSFPMVKFAYSHYHEQRRKIDRLVQGLPVLNSNGLSTLDRPSSKASTDDHVPIIIVNGEEPMRIPNTRSRSSSQPRRQPQHHVYHQHSHAHFSRGSQSSMHQQHSPHTARFLAKSFQTPNNTRTGSYDSKCLHRHGSGASKLYDVKDSITPEVTVTVDPALGLSANDRVARSKTAPSPNRNVTRARQRILTRRNNRILEHNSTIPLQNCWAMAELTW